MLDPREEHAWSVFYEAQIAFWRRLARSLQADTGLSEPDLAILTALVRAPDGAMRAYELGEVTDFEKSRLHHHLNRMVARGLICKDTPEGNSRGVVVSLTDEGRAAIDRAMPVRAAHIREWLIEPIGEDRIDDLTAISEALLARLQEAEKEGRDADAGGTCEPS